MELATTDGARASEFYRKVFGWSGDVVSGESPDGYTLFRVEDREVAGIRTMAGDERELSGASRWRLYVDVEDLDATVTQARSLGGEVLLGPVRLQTAGRMALLRDPTGAEIAVWEAAGTEGTSGPSTGALSYGALAWGELATRDAGRAGSFYTSLFGWGVHRRLPESLTAADFVLDGFSSAGMVQMTRAWDPGVAPHWLPYFAVADCDDAVENARESGGEVRVPPLDVPGMGRVAVLADPTGAVFAVICPAEA